MVSHSMAPAAPSGMCRYEDAAVRLGVSVSTIHRWVAVGRLRPVRVGVRTTYIPATQIERLLSGEDAAK